MSSKLDAPLGAFVARVEGTDTPDLPLFDHAPNAGNQAGANTTLCRHGRTKAAPATPLPLPLDAEISDPELWAEFLEAEASSPYASAKDWPDSTDCPQLVAGPRGEPMPAMDLGAVVGVLERAESRRVAQRGGRG